jgi:hypothetical protein
MLSLFLFLNQEPNLGNIETVVFDETAQTKRDVCESRSPQQKRTQKNQLHSDRLRLARALQDHAELQAFDKHRDRSYSYEPHRSGNLRSLE